MKKLILILLFIPLNTIGQDFKAYGSEQAFRDYFDKNGTELIEGIWEYSSCVDVFYRLK